MRVCVCVFGTGGCRCVCTFEGCADFSGLTQRPAHPTHPHKHAHRKPQTPSSKPAPRRGLSGFFGFGAKDTAGAAVDGSYKLLGAETDEDDEQEVGKGLGGGGGKRVVIASGV